MTPEEIAWLEEHHRLTVALAAAKQVEAAWLALNDRAKAEAEAAGTAAAELERQLAEATAAVRGAEGAWAELHERAASEHVTAAANSAHLAELVSEHEATRPEPEKEEE